MSATLGASIILTVVVVMAANHYRLSDREQAWSAGLYGAAVYVALWLLRWKA